MTILVTGGAGYIGSHTCVELLEENYDVVVIDNLVNSSEKSIRRVEEITGRKISFYQGDVRDKLILNRIFQKHDIDCVIHFAGLKSVSESVRIPLEYYGNNLMSTITLCEVMKMHDVKRLIFSSSATVYSSENTMPLTESSLVGGCTNPYGWSKYYNEQILKDFANSEKDWSVVLLRYFNPIGAHPSGLIGEDPVGEPNNLMPYISQVAIGEREYLRIFGNDYPTHDGTGVRDYIHVVDLAKGHVASVDYLFKGDGQEQVFNLGTGSGYSVLDLVSTFERITGIKISFRYVERRMGDLAEVYADTKKSKEKLFWEAKFSLDDMCRDAWNWQKNNPKGYNE